MKILFTLLLSTSLFAANFSNDIDKTFKEAKKENKPILIDFFGIWCPPCNELDEFVFESRPFLEKSKAFKLLKVDADKESSWKIKDQYQVGGYPTVLFTDSLGKEIYRITGYRTPTEFVRVMELVLKSKGKNIEKACASKDTEDLWRCALVCSEKKDNACAEKAFLALKPVLKPGTARYDLAQTYSAEQSSTEDLKRLAYEKLLASSIDTPQSYLWATSYLDLTDKEKQKPKFELIEKALANHAAFLKDPRNEELGISETDLAQMRADLLEKVGKAEEASKAWKEAATLLEAKAKQFESNRPERGFTIERVYALESAGETEKALVLATEYREKFPEEFTFHYQTASLLKRKKKYNDALPIAKKAWEHSYGDNKIRVGILLVQLYATIPDASAAKTVYDTIKSSIKPNEKLQVRTHRYLKTLEEEYTKLTGAKS